MFEARIICTACGADVTGVREHLCAADGDVYDVCDIVDDHVAGIRCERRCFTSGDVALGLLAEHGCDMPLVVDYWTLEDIIEEADSMGISLDREDADAVLLNLGELGMGEGLSRETVRDMILAVGD